MLQALRELRRMRPLAAIILPFFAMASALAEESAAPTPAPDPPLPPVERALAFMQKEAYRWKGAKGCAACHHAAMVVWSINEARARGHAVDEAARAELTLWAFTNMQENVRVDQAPPRNVINLGAVYTLMSAETAAPFVQPAAPPADPIPAARAALLAHIVGKQAEDGAWGLPLDERVPLGGPVEDIAILSRIALLQSGEESTTVTACLKKSAEWLAAHADQSSRQSRNFRLMMGLREGKTAEELKPVVDAIKAEQNADGGWSQTAEMPSDAYATGQSLYVLARAGAKPEEPELARGVAFLIGSQREDGSWPMTSRVNSKDMTPITETGTAWATLGIVRASP